MSAAALPFDAVPFPSAGTKRKRPSRAKTRPKAEVPPQATIPPRASRMLRDLLEKNPNLKDFSVAKIVQGVGGSTSFGTCLMMCSLPEVLPIPIPGLTAVVVLPTGIIAAQMMAGNDRIRLPKALLRRKIPRKALATAVHAILPFLEKTERYIKPRWKWATHPVAKRFVGFVVFLLALAIAVPLPFTNMPLAIAVFLIAIGLAENDGALILVGIVLGLSLMALFGGALIGLLGVLFGAA